MYGINEWFDKVKKAYGKLFKKSLSPIKKKPTTKKTNVKRTPRKKVNSIVNANELTDMQVWGCWCAIGFISAFIVMWII